MQLTENLIKHRLQAAPNGIWRFYKQNVNENAILCNWCVCALIAIAAKYLPSSGNFLF